MQKENDYVRKAESWIGYTFLVMIAPIDPPTSKTHTIEPNMGRSDDPLRTLPQWITHKLTFIRC